MSHAPTPCHRSSIRAIQNFLIRTLPGPAFEAEPPARPTPLLETRSRENYSQKPVHTSAPQGSSAPTMAAHFSTPPCNRNIQLHAVITFLGIFSLRTNRTHLPVPHPDQPGLEFPSVSSHPCRENSRCAGDLVDDRRSRYSRPWHRQSGVPARRNRAYRHRRNEDTIDRTEPTRHQFHIKDTAPTIGPAQSHLAHIFS